MADRAEIATEIEALAVHCRPPLMEAETRALWLRDWCSDLAEYPIEAIRVGCRKYRMSGATKFPTPGALIPLVKASLERPAEAAARDQAWRPLSDAEYEGLTLRGKIEHQRILANLARRKAGPMWLNGRPAGPDELPPRWHEWSAKAQHHEDEAQRLNSYLRQAQSVAAQ